LALVTAVLVLTGLIQIWMVYLAALTLGFVNAVDNPARQAFTAELVGADDVANAVALNQGTTMGARAFGPAVAGVVIAVAGPGWAFLCNAVTYVVMVAALRAMRAREFYPLERVAAAPGQVRAGIAYILGSSVLRAVIALLALASIFGFNFQVLFSLLVVDRFHLGPESYGALMSAMGGGAICGALLAAGTGPPTLLRALAWAAGFGAVLACLGLAPAFGWALVLAAVVGATTSLLLSTAAGVLQIASEPQFRGRVMAIYSVAVLGTAPIGGPLMGYLAEQLGPQIALKLGGLATLLAALAVRTALALGLGGRPAGRAL